MNAADIAGASFFFDEQLSGITTWPAVHITLPLNIRDVATTACRYDANGDSRVLLPVDSVGLLAIEHAPVDERAATALSAIGDMIDDEPLREDPAGDPALRPVVSLRLGRGRAQVKTGGVLDIRTIQRFLHFLQ